MDHQPPGLTFGAIGHQDNWDKVSRFVNSIRELKDLNGLSLQQIKEVYRYIPPRPLFDVIVQSENGSVAKGVYIETFIPPDELDTKFLRANIKKVKEACQVAAQLNIPIASLGGFTSIVLETEGIQLEQLADTCFTTGNTLTAGFIVKNIEKACRLFNVELENSSLLVIGSTGDIGSGCVKYFSGKVKELLLCARQFTPLQKQASLLAESTITRYSTNVDELLPKADVIISVASSSLTNCSWHSAKNDAIICDAGYPKNIEFHLPGRRIFYGGMGKVNDGYEFEPDYRKEVYAFPVQDIVHGCLLEAIVLGMEQKSEAYSKGRGHITIEAIERILQMAASHGIHPSPLFNANTILYDDQNGKKYQHHYTGAGATL